MRYWGGATETFKIGGKQTVMVERDGQVLMFDGGSKQTTKAPSEDTRASTPPVPPRKAAKPKSKKQTREEEFQALWSRAGEAGEALRDARKRPDETIHTVGSNEVHHMPAGGLGWVHLIIKPGNSD